MTDSKGHVKRPGPPELSQDPRRLKRKRLEAGLTMREAAAKSGCSLGIISELENGKYSAGAKTLRLLATAYDCRIADLMPREAAAA